VSTHRSSLQLVGIVFFGAAACGASVGPSTPAARSAWMDAAVRESRETLVDACYERAPIEALEPGDAELRACHTEASSAINDARFELFQDALDRCVAASAQSEHARHCCLKKKTDIDALEQSWQVACDRECSAKTGKALGSNREECSPVVIATSNPQWRSRLATPIVEATIKTCVSEHREDACGALATRAEQRYCATRCAATFVDAGDPSSVEINPDVLRCLGRADAGRPISCSPLEPDSKRVECERRCAAQLGRVD
jgi:hypothetical protein